MNVSPVNLPGILGEVAESFGTRPALNLAAEYGGTTLHIPKTASEESRLVRTVGLPAAQWLAETYGPGNLYIPLTGLGSRAKLRARIDELDGRGLSAKDIAKALGIANRTVHRRRARKRQGEVLPLFDIVSND